MRIYATYNIKGGVGKTTTAVNLAYLAAEAGQRTVLWDLDPQGAASFMFRVKPRVKGGGKAIIRGKRPLDDAIKGTDFDNLDLIPADFTYRNMDLLLDPGDSKPGDTPGGKPARKLGKLLSPLADEYDAVFLDCPPSVSLVSENVLYAADVIVVPLIPTTLSVRTLEQLSDFIDEFKGHRPQIAGLLLDGGRAQEAAPGDRREAVRRKGRRGRDGHPGPLGDRDHVGRACPGHRLRPVEARRRRPTARCGPRCGRARGSGPSALPHPRQVDRAGRRRAQRGVGPQPGAQPVHVGEDRAAQRPLAADAVGRGRRLEQRGQLVLLSVRDGKLPGQPRPQLLAVPGQQEHQLLVGADRRRQVAEDVGQPRPGQRVAARRVVAVDPGAVQDRAGQAAHGHRRVLQRLQALAQRQPRSLGGRPAPAAARGRRCGPAGRAG